MQKSNVGLAKETTFLFFVKIAGAVLAFVIQVLINKVLGTTLYGELSTYFSISMVLITILTFGTSTGLIKSVATSATKVEDIKKLYYALNIIIFFSVLLFACYFVANDWLLHYFHNKQHFVFVSLYSICLAFSNIFSSFFQGKKYTLFANIVDILAYNLLLMIGIYIVSFFTKSIFVVLGIYILAVLIIVLYKFLFIKNNYHDVIFPWYNKHFFYESFLFLGICAPFCLNSLCVTGRDMVLKVVLNNNMGGFDVGVFRILETYVGCMALFVSPFITLWPYMAEAYKNNKIKDLEIVYSTSVSAISLLTLPTMISMLICYKEVYEIFSLNYLSFKYPYEALFLMLIAAGFDAIIGPAGALLNMTKFGMVNLGITAFSSIFCIVLSLNIIPQYGLLGAVVAVSVSKIMTNLINALANYYLLNIWPYRLNLIVYLSSGLLLYSVGLMVYSLLPDILIAKIVIIAVVEVLLSLVLFLIIFKNETRFLINKLKKRLT